MVRIRTGYSFRTAAGTLDKVMGRLKECNYSAAPITDRASTFGWVRWSKLCEKEGLKPVFGVELAVCKSPHEKKPAVDYWTFIAQDSLTPLNELVELATSQFRYEPLLTYKQALEKKGVFKIIGSRSDLDHVNEVLGDWDGYEDKYAPYIGIGPGLAKGYAKKALGFFEPIAVSNNMYTNAEDGNLYEIVCGRGANTQTYDQFIQEPLQWTESVKNLALTEEQSEDCWENFERVLEGSNAKLKQATLLAPPRPDTLLNMCIEGAKKFDCDLSDEVYKARLDRELKLIVEKDYEDYFYIVADICTFARERMLVGPARGSSCGSLVCYLLGITTIDPIPYGLIFERFIDINRDDLPDIDIDFSDQQRYMVFDYMNEKYGSEYVARLGTVAMYKAKSSMKEAGTALKIPKWKCDAVVESLIERSSGDARALNTLGDTLQTMDAGKVLLKDHPEIMIAAEMEGHPRHHSQHAAGIVVCSEPIKNYMAVDHRTGATMCDKKDAEDLNLLKIDALGLTQLSTFEDCLYMAGLPLDFLEGIPLDDPLAFKVLQDYKFSGIFQFNGDALQRQVKQFHLDKFDDIISVTAIARPGPLASGGTEEWVNRRNGTNPVTFVHPVFEPYLSDTMGIIIYQEQVMEIGRNIGDLDWGQVTALRKAMSKSLGAEYFDQFGDPWKKGAIAKGVSVEDARQVWDDLCAYGSWSFNKSHSVAYGLISYQCCYLKAHYPFEFAAATLSHESDPDKQIKMLREMSNEGFGYSPVDKDYSTEKWAVGLKDGKKSLVGPLTSVKGIGPKLCQQIIGARMRGEKMPDRAAKLLQNPKTNIDSLFPIRDAIKRIMPDPAERNINTPPTDIVNIEIQQEDYDVLIFCTFMKINPRDENEAVKVANRGYELKGDKTASLNLFVQDDTDTIFCKVGRFDFDSLAKPIIDRGRAGKGLYAIKGKVRGGGSFRMIMVKQVRYIGDIDDE